MANGQLNLGKQSGGVLSVSFPDGATNTEVVLPESGTVVSIDTAVTDNTIARYDGTTGKLQDSGVTIEDNGVLKTLGNIQAGSADGGTSFTYIQKQTIQNVDPVFQSYVAGVITAQIQGDGGILCKSTGGIGYGAGAGGTVTQLTSKTTSVTLNKPCGRIIMNNAALASGASVQFVLYNSLISSTDSVYCQALTTNSIYRVEVYAVYNNGCSISVKNESESTLTGALWLNFSIIKGAIS